ncbi:MAG: MotA/TolQ/ExbB proton channel family protein [candidate division WOR-3 bacterium]|nr:MotA/TolQ/ExbB proton channel family protein [candidate division WOR-3 bacterium]
MNIFRVFLESSLAAQIIMVVLVIFSVWSWAIFFKKLYELGLTNRRGRSFLMSYQFHKNIKEMENLGHLLLDNPYGRILKDGIDEFKSLKSAGNPVNLQLAENIHLAMERARAKEIETLESGLPILGTIVAASPFLGLLGTVWGIMESFLQIRARGSAHITVVAPGISDALITTVYGLLVAIPALIFNNLLRSRIIKLDSQLDNFISEVFAKMRRELVESSSNPPL